MSIRRLLIIWGVATAVGLGAINASLQQVVECLPIALQSVLVTPNSIPGCQSAAAADPPAQPVIEGLTQVDVDRFAHEARELEKRLAPLWKSAGGDAERDRIADAAIFSKGIHWGLRYDRKFETTDKAILEWAVTSGRERVQSLERSELPWGLKPGRFVRGYHSRVDGSVQPFGLVIPKALETGRPLRLDVVLHGSTRPVGMSELRFASRFQALQPGQPISEEPYIELHPLGRVENCYRWAGETDVFEAIEAVCRQYPIDRRRIVLRGMSMGASGTWHLGLKHPDRFVALGPYCGYVDTHLFSETKLENFVKVGELPVHQEKGLHLLDSIDYAANGAMIPAIGCMGAKDVFIDAHEIMSKAYRREGLQMINLISPDTAHSIDPVTQREQLRLIGAFADRGLNPLPDHLRFVTWSLKYPRSFWVELQELGEHYLRSEFEARRLADGTIQIQRTININRFALSPEVVPDNPKIRFGEVEVDLQEYQRGHPLVLERVDDKWELVTTADANHQLVKSPGLQGPIDDAFCTSFLCVRGSGTPWHPQVHKWAMETLDQFTRDWSQYMRGTVHVVDDTQVTETDLRNNHLILFGDPGSNSLIASALPGLPISWEREQLTMGDIQRKSETHLPALVYPNPLPEGRGKYIVLNCGHTFGEAEFAKLNYLLFPRLGDWGVMQITPVPDKPRAEYQSATHRRIEDYLDESGYFTEKWQFPKAQPAE